MIVFASRDEQRLVGIDHQSRVRGVANPLLPELTGHRSDKPGDLSTHIGPAIRGAGCARR